MFPRRFLRTNPPSSREALFRHGATRATALGAWVALGLLGCESPDPETRMDEFADRSGSLTPDEVADATGGDGADAGADIAEDVAVDAPTNDAGDVCLPPDPEGVWFFALSANLDREAPLYFEITMTYDGETITANGQPLRYDADPLSGEASPDPRTAVGDPVPSSSAYDAQGCFVMEFPDVLVTGEANPLTGRDIEGTVIVDGCVVGENEAFGDMRGQIVAPLMLDLNGSTFAAVRGVTPFTDIDPVFYDETLPFEAWTCE